MYIFRYWYINILSSKHESRDCLYSLEKTLRVITFAFGNKETSQLFQLVCQLKVYDVTRMVDRLLVSERKAHLVALPIDWII